MKKKKRKVPNYIWPIIYKPEQFENQLREPSFAQDEVIFANKRSDIVEYDYYHMSLDEIAG